MMQKNTLTIASTATSAQRMIIVIELTLCSCVAGTHVCNNLEHNENQAKQVKKWVFGQVVFYCCVFL